MDTNAARMEGSESGNPKPETRNPELGKCNPELETRNPEPGGFAALNPQFRMRGGVGLRIVGKGRLEPGGH